MDNNLLKILNLAQSNNDRLVIYNPENPDNSWVAVSLEDYKKLIESEKNTDKKPINEELTESNSSDKLESVKEDEKNNFNQINKDLQENIEKENTTKQNIDKEEVNNSLEDNEEEISVNNHGRETYRDPGTLSSVKDVLEKKKDQWQIPRQVKDSATEVVE